MSEQSKAKSSEQSRAENPAPATPGEGLSLRTTLIALAVIVLVGLGLRIAHLAVVLDEPLLHVPAMSADAMFNDAWARQATGGETVLEGWPYYVSPLYPEYLRGLYWLFGPKPAISRVIQVILGSLAPLLVYWIARRFGDRRVGLVAAAIVAVYPIYIFYEATLIKTSVTVFVVSAAMAAVLKAAEVQRRRALWWLAAGVLMGVLCLIRSNVLLFAPMAVAAILWQGRRKLIPAAVCCATWAVGIAAVIAPVTIRNAVVANEFILINSNGGFSFLVCQWQGNQPGHGAQAFYLPLPGVDPTPDGEARDAKRLAERATGREMTAGEVSEFFFDQGWRHIGKHPAWAFQLAVDKALLSLNQLEVPNTEDFYFTRSISPVLRIPMGYGVVWPLAAWGLVLCWRKRPYSALVNLFLLANFASLVMFYVSARYRLPATPLLIVYAGVSLVWLWDRLGERAWMRLLPAVVVIGGLLWVAGLSLLSFDPRQDLTRPLVNAATYFAWKKDYPQAVALLQRVEQAEKGTAETAEVLGQCYQEQGDSREALRWLDEAVRRDPKRAQAYRLRGKFHVGQKRLETAAADFQQAVKLEPGYAPAWYDLGIVCLQSGRPAEAIPALEQANQLAPDMPDPYADLALLYAAGGDMSAARAKLAEGFARVGRHPRLVDAERRLNAATTAPGQ